MANDETDGSGQVAAGFSDTGRKNDTAWRSFTAGLALMSPSYFGLVMATGIVSIAAHLFGQTLLARGLHSLNLVQYVVLWGLYIARAVLHPRVVLDDLTSHAKGPSYFTVVAGTGVLASEVMLLTDNRALGGALTVLTMLLWLLLTYGIFASLMMKRVKPGLAASLNGSWLLAVVATQSVSVTSVQFAPDTSAGLQPILLFVALTTWLWGGMLYIWIITLIFFRHIFRHLPPDELTPPYWINMGATAISTLAGTLLIAHAPDIGYLQALLPFLKGFTLLYWATGTWWIPLLLMMGIWRYGIAHFPFRYTPLYWAAVFPLGMYAASTWQLRQVMDFPFLEPVAFLFFLAAILAWVLTFGGMLRMLVRQTVRQP